MAMPLSPSFSFRPSRTARLCGCVLLASALTLAGCGDDPVDPVSDDGRVDSGSPDAGEDVGSPDSGAENDGGTPDADLPDTGRPDADLPDSDLRDTGTDSGSDPVDVGDDPDPAPISVQIDTVQIFQTIAKTPLLDGVANVEDRK